MWVDLCSPNESLADPSVANPSKSSLIALLDLILSTSLQTKLPSFSTKVDH